MSSSRARSAGSPACSRCGLMRARLIFGGTGWRSGAWARAQAHQAAVACGAGQWAGLRAAALPQPADRRALAGFAAPQIGFNYLGRFAAGSGAPWTAAAEAAPLAGGGDAGLPLAHPLEVNALTVDGPDGARLTASWSWAAALLSEQQVEELAQGWFQALEALVRHAAQPGAGGRSPCDLPLLALARARSSCWRAPIRRSRTSCRCRRCRRGFSSMRFMMRRRRTSTRCNWRSPSTGRSTAGAAAAVAALLDAACQPARLLPAGGAEPAGADHRAAGGGAVAQHDLSSLDDAERGQRLAAILAQDRAERFDLGAAPLLRFTLVRLAPDAHRLIVSSHHILMDGWSTPVLVRELLTLYAHKGDAAALPRVTPYGDYLAWLGGQDRAAASAAWREALAGLEEPTLVAARDRARAPVAPEQITLALSEQLTTALNEAARAAWAHAQHLHPGGLGNFARPADRPQRCGVRGDGGGAAAGDCRHREHGGAVHQHAAAAHQAAGRQAADRSAARRAGQPIATDRAPASRAGGDPGAGRIGRAVRHAGGVRELSGRPCQPGSRCRRSAACRGERAGCHALSVGPWRCRANSCGCGSTIGPTCSIARAWRRWRAGSCGCWRPRLRMPIGRSAASIFSPRRSATCILREWNATAQPLAPATLARPVRRPGGRTPDAVAVVFEEQRLSYARARRARQPAGASSARARGRARERGRAVRRALARNGGRAPRHPQGRRRLSAARSRISGRAARLHAGGRRRVGAGHPVGLLDRLPAHGARIVRLDADAAAIAAAAHQRARARARSAATRLCDLHLRLHRSAKGRRCYA